MDVLVVDDINLIKKNKQLDNLEKVLAMLPANKQNIVYTNRRSKETQDILSKIMQTPSEIKINKDKEQEVDASGNEAVSNPNKMLKQTLVDVEDKELEQLAQKLKSFNGKVPQFLLLQGVMAQGE